MDKFSYGLGMNIGQNLASMGVSTLEFADFVKGMQDVLSGKQTEITVVEAQNAINDFFNKLTEEKYGKTKESGIAFLEENKKREGVVTLPSGLQYEIINAGLGKKPTAADRVQCHYEGTLIDGTVLYITYDLAYGANGAGEMIPPYSALIFDVELIKVL